MNWFRKCRSISNTARRFCLPFAVALTPLAVAAASTWDAPTLAPPDAGRLTGAWLAAQARNAHRLAAEPLDKPEFILDDVLLKQHRKFAEYSGDISGRWIGAAAFLARQFPKDFAAFPAIMGGFEPLQKRDGHFGAEQQLPKIERGRDMPILWGNGRLLIGLVEVYERTCNPKALEMARKLGDYFIATDPIYNKAENIRGVGGSYSDGFVTCYFSCIEGLVGLGVANREERYLDEASRIAGLAATVTNFDGLHSHGRLCAVRGFADLYGATRNPRWREAAERDWKVFVDRHVLPSGGVKETLSPEWERDEGCAEADWLRLNLSLWRLTGEGQYLDAAERSLKNHFIYQQFPNGGAGHRVLHQVEGRPVAFKALSEEAWWCCSEHWARAMVDVARSAVTSTSSALFINLAVDCESSVGGPGGTWKTALHETEDGLSIRLEAPKRVKAEVRIHRPAWAKDGVVEAPNGLKVRSETESWVVEGSWRGNTELQVHLRPQVRVESERNGSAVLVWGHDLLVAAPSPRNAWLTDKLPSVRPVMVWAAARRENDGKVVVPASLTPNADPGRPEQWQKLELSPLRSQAAVPEHQLAWFSFQLQPAKGGKL